MSKNCVMCNKKIGLFEKMYEDKYCKECYEIIQNKNAEAKRKLEEERIKEEKRIEKALSELTKIQKDSSDKQVVSVLESIKKELNYLV